MDDLKVNSQGESSKEAQDPEKLSRTEKFRKTSRAAKLSGAVNGAAGFMKIKLGQMTGNPQLMEEGRNQQLVGQIHSFVGSARKAKERVSEQVIKAREKGAVILRKHHGKLIDQAIEFLTDIKEAFVDQRKP